MSINRVVNMDPAARYTVTLASGRSRTVGRGAPRWPRGELIGWDIISEEVFLHRINDGGAQLVATISAERRGGRVHVCSGRAVGAIDWHQAAIH
jgi:hypothetical protein